MSNGPEEIYHPTESEPALVLFCAERNRTKQADDRDNLPGMSGDFIPSAHSFQAVLQQSPLLELLGAALVHY